MTMTETIQPTVTSTQGALVAYDYGSDKGAGFQGLGQDHYKVPRLLVLQTNNPQCTEGTPAFLAEARAGMLWNSVSNDLINGRDGKQTFVACGCKVSYAERTNDDQRTFRGRHDETSEVVREAIRRNGGSEFGKLTTADGSGRLMKTFEVYGILLDADGNPTGPVVVPFASTKIKNYQTAMTLLRGVPGDPPIFAFRLALATIPDKNAKGNFFNLRMTPANGTAKASLLPPNSEAYQAARAFANLVAAGAVKAADETQNEAVVQDDAADKAF